MVKKAVSKIYRGGGGKYYLYLPKNLVTDSMFPFSLGDRLEVEIVGDVLVVKREKSDYPGVGPFILGLYLASIKNAEAAERILEEKGGELTPEQREYLMHVVEEGRRNQDVYARLMAKWFASRMTAEFTRKLRETLETVRKSSGKPPKA